MTFGIREKVSLLVFLAAAGSAFLVARGIATKSREVLRQHEVVDLGDEAQLRGWTLSDKVDGLAEDLGSLAFSQEFFDAVQSGVSSERLAELAKTICRRYWKDYVHIDIVRIERGKPVYLPVHSTVELDKEYQWLPEGIGRQLHLSPIMRVPLVYPANGELPARVRGQPIIWGIAPLSPFGLGFEDQNYVRIATSLEVPPSSRQLYVLENDKGEPLQRADELIEEGKGNDSVFRELSRDPLLLSKLQENAEAKPDTSQPRVSSLLRKDGIKLEQPYYFVEGVPGQKLSSELEFDNLAFHEELRDKCKELGRIGGMSSAMKELRLMADSREKLRKMQDTVVATCRKYFGWKFDGIDWRHVVECDEIHSSVVQVLIGAGDEIDRYIIHYAVMEDELASSMEDEMRQVRLVAMTIALGAGVVGFVIAMLFIRPLKAMTMTAQQITESKSENLSTQLKVLISRLAIKRRDELGEISRASKRLFEEIIDANDKLEQRVIDRTSELRKANSELEQANVRLKSLSHEKDSFVAKVSHDLRQPLNAIFLQVEALKLSELDEIQKDDVEKIHAHATRELNLVNDILEYQKIIMGAETLVATEIHPRAMAQDLDANYRHIAEAKGIGFEISCPDDMYSFHADERRVRQVLGNLLSNACKFTKSGKVSLSVEPRKLRGEEWVEFLVTDTGRGMSPEEQSKAFKPFVSNKKDNPTGTGLGLSICKELTERMGGKIGFMSALGEGTCFTVLMPREATAANYRNQKNEEESLAAGAEGLVSTPWEAAARIARHAEAAPVGGAKVLVIDDEPSVRELLKRLLEGDGYKVITAENGGRGLEAARRERPDAITLDVVMPGDKDGWQVLKELKAQPETENIPVIMVSIAAELDNGFALDVEDYLVKPIDIDRLSRVVSRVTRSAPQRNLLIVDDDVDSREVLGRILKESGWSSQFASNGLEALEVLKKTRPAAIVLDLLMPEMDGFEFLKTIQNDHRMASIPVIVMTGKEPTDEERRFLEARVGMILRKDEASGSKRVLATITQKLRPRPDLAEK